MFRAGELWKLVYLLTLDLSAASFQETVRQGTRRFVQTSRGRQEMRVGAQQNPNYVHFLPFGSAAPISGRGFQDIPSLMEEELFSLLPVVTPSWEKWAVFWLLHSESLVYNSWNSLTTQGTCVWSFRLDTQFFALNTFVWFFLFLTLASFF